MIFADTAPDAATVTPGIAGFLTFFALAVIVVLLVLNMSKHLRRIDARAAQEEAEEAAAREAGLRATPPSPVPRPSLRPRARPSSLERPSHPGRAERMSLRVAVGQLAATEDGAAGTATALALVARAAEAGARLVLLPEYTLAWAATLH